MLQVLALLLCLLPNLSAAVVSLEAGSGVAYERGVVNGTCRLTRSSPSGTLSVNLRVLSGSDALGADYELEWFNTDTSTWDELGGDEGTVGTVGFLGGQQTVDIRLRPVDDAEVEGREILVLAIAAPVASEYSIGLFPSRTFIIADDDHQARIEVVQPLADEDVSLAGDPDDPISRRRGIVRVLFDEFANVPSYAARRDFPRNLSVQIISLDSGGLPLATLGASADYTLKYKICGHNNPATATDTHSQYGYAFNSSSLNSSTTGLHFKLMAALAGEDTVALKEQDPDDESTNVIPSGTQFFFDSDPTKRIYTSVGDAISAITFTPTLNRPVPSGTKLKITSVGGGGTAPDSVVIEAKYSLGDQVLKVGGGFGQLYEGDVIMIEGDPSPYVITADPVNVLDANGRYSAEISIFAHQGGSGGGLGVEQTGAAGVTTSLTPVVSADGFIQIIVPDRSRKVEFSIEPNGLGDGTELAEYVRLRMIADNDYIIQTPQDALVTIADRDSVGGVSVETNAGLPDIQGTVKFSLSKAFTQPVNVPFTLTSTTLDALGAPTGLDAEGVTFETLPRVVTFAPGQKDYLLRVVPIAGGDPASLTVTLLGTEDYKTGGSPGAGTNPSATMRINDVTGTVTILATDSVAVEGPSANNGLFTVSVSRLAGQNGLVALRLAVGGTAVPGSRYEFFNPLVPTQTYAVAGGYLTQVQIPAAANSVQIGVRPLDNQSAEGGGSVQLSVNNQGTDYVIGTPDSAVVTILDNEPTLSVIAVTDAYRPSTPGIFRFSYPVSGGTLDQNITVNYTFSGAVRGTDFDGQTSVLIPANSPSGQADLIINPTADGTATSLTVTITSSTAYHVNPTLSSATISFIPEDEDGLAGEKPTPGTVNSGSSSGGCGLGSGVAGLIALGMFALLAFRRRQD